MQKPRPQSSATQTALCLVSRRALTVTELSQRLQAAGFEAAAVRTAVDAMRRYRYVDDDALATAISASALRRGRGPLWIKNKLHGRGVPADVARQAAHVEADAELAAASALVARRYKNTLSEPATRARAMRFLCNRGFTLGCARAAIEVPLPLPSPLPLKED